MTEQTVVATMEVGSFYEFNFAGVPAGRGTFEGWTDFGWMIFTTLNKNRPDDTYTETRFYNPAMLCTIRPETFDSIIAG